MIEKKKKSDNKSLENYNQAIKLNPKDAEAYYNRGTIYFTKGEYEKALADFNQATELKPDYMALNDNKYITCLKKENKEYLNLIQRARADAINVKRESGDKILKSNLIAKEELILDFLQIIDSFEGAFKNKEAWEKVSSDWRIGMEFIYNQILKIFEENGVLTFGQVGDTFNPNLYESLESVAIDKKEKDGIVIDILTKGYKTNDRVLRVSKVKVGRFIKK